MKNNDIFSKELLETLNSKKDENKAGKILKEMIDGKPKNINPLKKIPESQMRIYGFSGMFGSVYFDTEKELIDYIKNNDTTYGDVCIIDFLGNVAGCSDVIKVTYKSGKEELLTAVDEDGYGVYNRERSIYKGEYVWEYNYGTNALKEEYDAFRNRGIVFENDIYALIEKRNKTYIKICEEIFNSKNKQIS